jgi:outer membrane protein TolC
LRASQTNAATLDTLASLQAAQQRAAAAQFQAGAVDRLEVLAAELELNAAEAARLEGRIKLQQAVAQLEDAIQHPLEAWPALEQGRPTQAKGTQP